MFMEVEILLAVCLHLLRALHDTPTTHSRTFPVHRQRNFPAHGGYWARGLLLPSGPRRPDAARRFLLPPRDRKHRLQTKPRISKERRKSSAALRMLLLACRRRA